MQARSAEKAYDLQIYSEVLVIMSAVLIICLISLQFGIYYCKPSVDAPNNSDNWSLICNSTICEDAVINCPTNADCNISCPTAYACYNATINWPRYDDGHYGTISCLGESSCTGISSHPQPNPNQDYILQCGGHKACFHSEIRCPTNANCLVQCGWEGNPADDACGYSYINWPANGNGTLECEGQRACYGVNFPEPPPNQDFTFQCAPYNGICWEATIQCPSNADCHINCTGTSPTSHNCAGAFIDWSNDIGTNSELTCVSATDCGDASTGDSVNRPPIHAPDNFQDFNLICDKETCYGAIINCPTNANCNISCDTDHACTRAIINWPIAPYGYGIISCEGYESCPGISSHPIPNPNEDYTLKCGHFNACGYSRIYCPTNANCEIQCGWVGNPVHAACLKANISWPINGNGTIICEGKTSCDGVNLPIPNPNKHYYLNASYEYQYREATITCPKNADCDIICGQKRSCQGADIRCSDNSESKCHIICAGPASCVDTNVTWSINGENVLNCAANQTWCSGINLPPTSSPTTEPTNNPSDVPTAISDSPSLSPSQQPTTPKPTVYVPPAPTAAPSTASFGISSSPTQPPSMMTDSSGNEETKDNTALIFGIIGSVIGVVLIILCIIIIRKMHTDNGLHRISVNSNLSTSDAKTGDTELQPTTNAKSRLDMFPADSYDDENDQDELIKEDVKEWLTGTVRLPQYYDHFVKNGFETIEFITKIKDKDDLNGIGISLKGHQLVLMEEIKKLSQLTSAIEGDGADNQKGLPRAKTPIGIEGAGAEIITYPTPIDIEKLKENDGLIAKEEDELKEMELIRTPTVELINGDVMNHDEIIVGDEEDMGVVTSR